MSLNRLYIIDGHSQLFRAYYAIRRLSNSKGLPTNAIYGFVQMLNKLLREEEPEYIVVAFDAPGETFRTNIYTEYKANRAPSPPDMEVQIPWVKKILSAMGIPMVEIQGVEADDVIGTLAKLADKHNIETIIVSSDKDLFQLIGPRIKVLRQHHEDFRIYDADAVKSEIGVPPEKITDLFGLMGDSTDNIPGVPKIGPKSAAKLLAQFDSLEELYQNLDKVENPKWRELLRTHKDMAFLSKKLATIKTDVPLSEALFHNGFDLEQFRWRGKPRPELYDIYRELEFQTLLKEQAKTVDERKVDYSVVTTRDSLSALVSQLEKSEIFSIDTETTSNDPMEAEVVGISISYKPNSAYYIPVGHTRDLFSAGSIQLDKREVISALRPLLESDKPKKTFH
ncbi:DNA polymerase I, partial [Candidatus Sumerlaeota bacterium]|nr:DNA polymerase I [Candidatus Sumerlaeota bacterium]